jgi:cyclopropane-fatty-acyl-phospholipid synthase
MTDTVTAATRAEAVPATLAFLRDLLGDYPGDFAVRLWNGAVWQPDPGGTARFTLVLRHPGALRAMLWPPGELTLTDAYLFDDVDLEGDLEAAFALADHLLLNRTGRAQRLQRARQLLALPGGRQPRAGRSRARLTGRRASLERDRQAIAYHYDLSNEFFALWLDPTMAYSCAVFDSPDDDLDVAQQRKLEYVCRKLRLRPGDRVLDIGCGWGGLILHAASRFGADATGVTLSRAQADLVAKRIREHGLEDRCRVQLRDYREIDATEGFDKLASVGMLEHVAEAALPDYFGHAWRLLRPGGVFLAHGMGVSPAAGRHAGGSFIRSYVFPDYSLVPIASLLAAAEATGFEVRDVESLREHYVLTTRAWLRRLESCRDEARRLTTEATYRVWRLLVGGCAYGFASGRMNVYQTLLAKPAGGVSGLPLSRADWYAGSPRPTT